MPGTPPIAQSDSIVWYAVEPASRWCGIRNPSLFAERRSTRSNERGNTVSDYADGVPGEPMVSSGAHLVGTVGGGAGLVLSQQAMDGMLALRVRIRAGGHDSGREKRGQTRWHMPARRSKPAARAHSSEVSVTEHF